MRRFIFVTILVLAWPCGACGQDIDPNAIAQQEVRKYDLAHRAHPRAHVTTVWAGSGVVVRARPVTQFLSLAEVYEDNVSCGDAWESLIYSHRFTERLVWNWTEVVWPSPVWTTLRIPDAAAVSEMAAWSFSLSGASSQTLCATHQESVTRHLLIPAHSRATMRVSVAGANLTGRWSVPLYIDVLLQDPPDDLHEQCELHGSVSGLVGFITQACAIWTSNLPSPGISSKSGIGVR